MAGIVAIALAGVVLAAWCWHFAPHTVDDAFISLRYAQMLAEGHGPTWNPVGPPVEGYTSFAWIVLMALPHALGWNAVGFAKAVGVGCTAATLLLVFGFVRRSAEGASHFGAIRPEWIALAALVVFPGTGLHATAGMETPLFTLLLTALLFCTHDFLQTPRRATATQLALLALALGLTRPEGNLAAGVALAATAALVREPALRRALAGRVLLLYVLPGAAYFAWRFAYYELLLPLPFYLKVADPDGPAGLRAVSNYLRIVGFGFGLLLVPGLAGGRRAALPTIAAVAALLAFFVLPRHEMGYYWRYCVPTFPALAAWTGLGGARVAAWIGARRGNVAATAAQLTAAALMLTVLATTGTLQRRSLTEVYAPGLEAAHVTLGRALAKLRGARPDGELPLLSIGDAGAVPYYSGWRAIDHYGLNDVAIATTGERRPAYVLDQRPDVVVIVSARPKLYEPPAFFPDEPALLRASLGAGYAPAARYRFSDRYWLWVLAQPGSEFARSLAEAQSSSPPSRSATR